MNPRTPLAFHVGLHKTGTSFLQQEVFPRFEDLHYVHGDQTIRELLLRPPSPSRLLVSDESLSGRILEGAWMEEFHRNMRVLERLWDHPAIIIGFRRHDRLLLSLYKQYLHRGGTGPVSALFDPAGGGGLIKPGELRFRERLELVDRLFDRIFVYTQEQLLEDPHTVAGDLADFLGTSVRGTLEVRRKNVGVGGAFQAGLLRRLNRLNNLVEKLPGTPSLYNPAFRRWKVTPRRICQNRLTFLPGPPLELGPELSAFLLREYGEDWNYVRERTRASSYSAPREP